jgi:hypothetical protein
LRLDHCFVKPKNEDAEVIEVDVGGEKKKIVMAPGMNRLLTRGALDTVLPDIRPAGYPATPKAGYRISG